MDTTTVNDVAQAWLSAKKGTVAHATYSNYEKAVRLHLSPIYGQESVSALSHSMAVEFIHVLNEEKGLSPGYIQVIYSTACQILDFAVEGGFLNKNPWKTAKKYLPSREMRDYTILSREQVQSFIGQATPHKEDLAIWLMLVTGLRPQELCGLKWGDWDCHDGWLEIRRVIKRGESGWFPTSEMKTARSRRRLKVPEKTCQALNQYRERTIFGQDDHFIFLETGSNEPFIKPSDLRSWFKVVKPPSWPNDLRLYDLRHTHISHLLMNGVNLKKVSARAGHSSITQTADTYAHLTGEAEEEMAKVSEEMYGA